MTVQVTKEHIEKARLAYNEGCPKACNCPIALALKDAGFFQVVVGPAGMFYYTEEPKELRTKFIPLSDICKHFINKFDENYNTDAMFEPFSFEIKP
jgi:hypothetical protein